MKHILPKWFYHKEEFPNGKIVFSEEEFLAMPAGFVESPARFENDEIKIDDSAEEKAIAEKHVKASKSGKGKPK